MPFLKRALALTGISLLLYISYGLYLGRYVPERSDAFLWAVYHVHSALSDGLLPPQGIAKAAKQANVDLVLLTDHGKPHFEASIYRAKLEGVEIVGGSEVAMVDGHLTFFGANRMPLFKLPPHPPDAVADITRMGRLFGHRLSRRSRTGLELLGRGFQACRHRGHEHVLDAQADKPTAPGAAPPLPALLQVVFPDCNDAPI